MAFDHVQISACALVSPYGLGFNEFERGIQRDTPPRVAAALTMPAAALVSVEQALVPEYDVKEVLGRKGIRNLDRLTRLVATASELLHRSLGFHDVAQRREHYPDEQTGILLGTSGGLQSILDFDAETIRQPALVQPGLFPNLVFNAAASYASIRHAIRASCITLTNGATSSLDAIAMGASQVRMGRSSLALAGGGEAFSEARVLSYAAEHQTGQPVYGEGVALFSLERKSRLASRQGQARAGIIMSRSGMLFEPGDLEARLSLYLSDGGIAADSVAHVYCHADTAAHLGAALPCARVWEIDSLLGDMSAARGAFSLAHALSNPAIASGESVLLFELDKGGAISLLLVGKGAL